jgi:hypothetical protein
MTRTSTSSVGGGGTNANRSRVINLDQSQDRIVQTTTAFEGDYGVITLQSDNFIGNDYSTGGATGKHVGFLVDMDKVHIRQLKTPGRENFPDLGGGQRILVEAVAGLQVDNPIGLGAFKPTGP